MSWLGMAMIVAIAIRLLALARTRASTPVVAALALRFTVG
jgi:hypothetical protein